MLVVEANENASTGSGAHTNIVVITTLETFWAPYMEKQVKFNYHNHML